MAKYDFGGGCPCGIQKVCDCAWANKNNVQVDDTTLRGRLRMEHDYGFTAHYEADMKPTNEQVFLDRGHALMGLKEMIMPLLSRLKENPDREIIKWPNRGPVIDEFIVKMDAYIASQTGGVPCSKVPTSSKGRKK